MPHPTLLTAFECHWTRLDDAISQVDVTLSARGEQKCVAQFQVSMREFTDERKEMIEVAALELVRLACNAKVVAS